MAQAIAFEQAKNTPKEEIRQALRAVVEEILTATYVSKKEETTTMVEMSFSAQREMRFEDQDIADNWEKQLPFGQAKGTTSIPSGGWSEGKEWQWRNAGQWYSQT